LVIASKKVESKEDEVEERVFTSLGLSEQEWDVYTFLCKAGPLKAIDIARNLGSNRVLIYVYLKNLQKKGLVEGTIGVPQRFLAVPPKKMMRFCIEKKKNELREIIKDKKIISDKLSYKSASFIQEERIALIQGVSRYSPKVRRMINDCSSEFLCLLSPGPDVRVYESLQWESIENFIELASSKPKVDIKIIATSCTNIDACNKVLEKSKNYGLKLEVRQADFDSNFRPSSFFIRDKTEGFFHLSSIHMNVKKDEAIGLWTNNKSLIETLGFLFDMIWKTSRPVCLSKPAGILHSKDS
jgi:sugar-specific transcriptional regulator TrmB